MIKKILYSIDSFKTKQALFDDYKEYSEDFSYDNWIGEFYKKYEKDYIKKILEDFKKKKDFELIHKSDYRYTYKNGNLGIYLKYYDVFSAKYSKTTIFKRNILRRNLAKKSFVLHFILKTMNIKSIEPVFYAGNRDSYISKEAVFISKAENGFYTIDTIFNNISQKGEKGSYTENFFKEIDFKDIDLDKLIFEFGRFSKKLLENGIRIYHRELVANSLMDKNYNMTLCDLDVINAISKYNLKEKNEEYKKLLNHLEKIKDSLQLDIDLSYFNKGILNA